MVDKKHYQSVRPQGHETRGKTTRNRLRRVDNFVLIYAKNLLQKQFSGGCNVFVDLGYGEYPFTTVESAMRFHIVNDKLFVVGVEIDKKRVANASTFKNKRIDFRHGGFNLPIEKDKEQVSVLRAFNVLRQYKKEQFKEAYSAMLPYITSGGLVIEGTSDPLGRIWVANIFRKISGCLRQEAIVFSTNFHCEFHPETFQTVLPKNYIECMVKGEKIYDFFVAWKSAYHQSLYLKNWGQRQLFKKTVTLLTRSGHPINPCKKYVSRGYLLLYLNDENYV
ncbi:hypothetical protein [Candidatus Uabimicrobium sp. HlEnr_7]|uniref:hypothetical protein n=1 Tax=Candidatus Uabimicrobium helgolandensis TaxID=3095367 RepID=UPI003557FFAB